MMLLCHGLHDRGYDLFRNGTLPVCDMLVPLPFGAETGENTVAFFSIASFITIFVVGIIWATRPARKQDSHH